MVKAGAMALNAAVPKVSGNAKEQELLEEDLHRIGCHRLYGEALEPASGKDSGGADERQG